MAHTIHTEQAQTRRIRKYIDVPTVLDMLGIERSTLDRLIEEEGFPCVRISPRLRRFDLDAVYAWIDSRWSQPTPASKPDDEAAA